ncbi:MULTISPECIES: hypothetical protein [unclassified Aeromicrobium]|uniref:hypothetical protein n=1 Tax=unclassified Aeromicrobium TaxID=2633570 RepID=UPI000A3DD709|nr:MULTISPECIES: hypothetical protein [unclassified Aeromicrobium]
MRRSPDESPRCRRRGLRSRARSEIALGVCSILYWIMQIWAGSTVGRQPGWPTWTGIAVGFALIAWGVRRYRADIDPRS